MLAASKTAGVTAAAPSTGDPYWSSVSLLTNFENNLSFQDGSTNNYAVTRIGATTPNLNTPFSGGVGGSFYLNGTSSGLRSNLNAVNIRTAHTIEGWVNVKTTTGFVLFSGSSTAGVEGDQYYLNEFSGSIYLGDGVTNNIVFSASLLTLNVWNHVAVTFDGTTYRVFINGSSVGSSTSLLNNNTLNGISVCYRIPQATSYTSGNVSNFRVVKGTAVYTTAFTPPTAPLTAISGTSLLITGTGQGMYDNTAFVDQGPNALTVTATGSPVYSGLSPFGNTYAGSVYLNSASSQYLTVGPSTLLNNNSVNYTVEAWAYLDLSTYSSSGLMGRIIITDFGADTNSRWYLNIGTTGKLEGAEQDALGTNAITITDTVNFPLQQYVHVALVKNGTTLSLYKNGVLVGSATSSVRTGFTGTVRVGVLNTANAYTGYWQGNISNARVVKGTALYTSNFTPSTTPLTAVTNTSLLIRGDTGAFYDLSTNSLVETSAGTTVVTTQAKKFGSESGSFPSSSYISLADNVKLQMGSGDFTIEFWLNFSSLTNYQTIFDKGYISAGGLLIQTNTGTGTLIVYAAGSAVITASSASSTGSWDFYALVRSGSTLTLYRNGTSVGSATNSTNFNNTGTTFLGGSTGGGGYYFNGYLDDIRVTKGVARYTANFTPPTQTFPTGP